MTIDFDPYGIHSARRLAPETAAAYLNECSHPALRFLSASILFNSSVRSSARPSFLRVNNMTSSVLILFRPACLANDSRSTAAFPEVGG